MVGEKRAYGAERRHEITNDPVQRPCRSLVVVVQTGLHHLKVVARKQTGTEGFERLGCGVDVKILPRFANLVHGGLEFSENPSVFGCKFGRSMFEVFRDFELGSKASHVEKFGQNAEVFLFDFFGIDLKIITDLCIARLPKSEAFASNLVGSQAHRTVGSLDLPRAGPPACSAFQHGICIDPVAERFAHFSPPRVHAKSVDPNMLESGLVENQR